MSEVLTDSAAFKATQEAIQTHASGHTMAEVMNHCLPNKTQDGPDHSVANLYNRILGALHISQNENPTGTACLTQRPRW